MTQSETLLYDGCLYRKVGTPDIQKEARKRLRSYEALCANHRESEKALFEAYESELIALIDEFATPMAVNHGARSGRLPARPRKDA